MPGPYSRRTDHPYLVKSLQDLPDGLRPLAGQTLEAGEPAETIFVMPAQSLPKNFGGRGGMHGEPHSRSPGDSGKRDGTELGIVMVK